MQEDALKEKLALFRTFMPMSLAATIGLLALTAVESDPYRILIIRLVMFVYAAIFVITGVAYVKLFKKLEKIS